MLKINLIGGGFQHSVSSTLFKVPKYISWVKDKKTQPISFYLDHHIPSGLVNNDKEDKYALILQSNFLVENVLSFVLRNREYVSKKYKIIFTHNQQILKLGMNFKFCPAYGTYIQKFKPDLKKTKLISMVSSNKNWYPGHQKRLQWVQKLKDKVDFFGRGVRPIRNKQQALQDYMFSVAIQNGSYRTYFTQKITDCFATKTIPIYIGAPDIGDYFCEDGIIKLDDNFDMNCITPQFYKSKLARVNKNFQEVKKYDILQDWIYINYLKEIYGE